MRWQRREWKMKLTWKNVCRTFSVFSVFYLNFPSDLIKQRECFHKLNLKHSSLNFEPLKIAGRVYARGFKKNCGYKVISPLGPKNFVSYSYLKKFSQNCVERSSKFSQNSDEISWKFCAKYRWVSLKIFENIVQNLSEFYS